MTEQPLVSVVINCYNGEEFLRDTIDSVINQTYSNWELIFWDNQSTDSTSEIVKSYRDDRIRYFYAPYHTPLGEARNNAINNVKGGYLTFLDSDDLWHPDFLEKGIGKLEKCPDIIGFYSNSYALKGGKKILTKNEKSGLRTISDIIINYQIDVSACIIKSDVVFSNNIRFNSSYQMIEDYDFFIKVAVYGSFYYEQDSLASFRVHLSETYKKRGRWYDEYLSFRDYSIFLYNSGVISAKCIEAVEKKIIESKLGKFIDKNERLQFLIHFFCHPCILFKYWHLLVFVLIGKDKFIKLANKRLSV